MLKGYRDINLVGDVIRDQILRNSYDFEDKLGLLIGRLLILLKTFLILPHSLIVSLLINFVYYLVLNLALQK